ncbi:glycosyltransferase family 2 protein [Raoultella ornithinolytica]|uniref:glycosyltransferase family 2 protein n=1 Tax=Raoultella ornithinolytica TaxID=54291 RepID=UPI003388EDA9
MSTKDIYAVIVTFHPRIEQVKKLLQSLNAQGISSITVDNGTLGKKEEEDIINLTHVLRLNDNFGIAKAQNEGIMYAKSSGAKYILFFDQDSDIQDDFINSLMKDFKEIEEQGIPIAVMGPTFIDSRYKFYYKQIRLDKYGVRKKVNPQDYSSPFEVTIIISSGSLVPVSILDDVGYMDENLFIDYVDTEWCLRAISKGYKIYVSNSAIMEHAIGDKMITFGGVHIPVHSPIRRYYRIRNAIIFAKMPHIPLMLKIRDNVINMIHQMLLIVTQKNKLANIRIAFKAIFDGLSGKTGRT